MKTDDKWIKERLGKVGGQAVMEGVMMRSKTNTAIAVRQLETKKIVARVKPSKTIRDRIKFFKTPVIRGMVNFIEMMILSISTMTASADMLGLEEEQPSKFEKWLEKRFGASLMTFISVIATIFGVALSLFLFIFLPTGSANLVEYIYGGDIGWFKVLIEGVMKIAIFVAYIALTSLIPDIKRVFMYHGAEHKSVFCYEAGEELTPENVKKHSRFHPRCGTSLMFVMIIISIVISSLIPLKTFEQPLLRVLIKIISLPFIVGIGFEFLMYAGKHTNILTKVLSAPGMWMQRITTKEPDEGMMEVAIVALKAALPMDFPDFVIPLENKKMEESQIQESTEPTENPEPVITESIETQTKETKDKKEIKIDENI